MLQTNVNETKTELANAETRLNESITNNLPMDIGEQYSFVNALKPLAGIQVELRSIADGKAQQTVESLRSTFLMAGWPVINFGLISDIGEEGVVIGYNGDDSSKKAANFLLKLLTERGVPSEITIRVRGVPTNAIIVAVCQRPSQLKASWMVMRAKEKELNDQKSKILPRFMELMRKQYVIGSKEMAAAQAEVNDLNLQLGKLESEKAVLFEQERKLDEEMEKEALGTNALAPGVYMIDNTFSGFSGNGAPIRTETNTRVIMKGNRINPPPLQ